ALVAQFDVQVGLGRAGGERVPARAGHGRFRIVRMDSSLHDFSSVAWPSMPGATVARQTAGTGALAISARNSSLLLVVLILSMSSSSPAADEPPSESPLSTRRRRHTSSSCLRSNSNSSCRVELPLTSRAG